MENGATLERIMKEGSTVDKKGTVVCEGEWVENLEMVISIARGKDSIENVVSSCG